METLIPFTISAAAAGLLLLAIRLVRREIRRYRRACEAIARIAGRAPSQ